MAQVRLGLVACVLPVMVAACVAPTPQDLGNMAMQRTAYSVVYPILNQRLYGNEASLATQCVVKNATGSETQLLVQDYGGQIATRARAIVNLILTRPATRTCLDGAGLDYREL